MILLLGGTSESAPIASQLAELGYRVLVSRATAAPLDVGCHHRILERIGRLDADGMAALVEEKAICAIVDATHPYAAEISKIASSAAKAAGVDYFRFERPPAVGENDAGVVWARDHAEAARRAFSCGTPVLLTVGSRNLSAYAELSRRAAQPLFVRVLPEETSLESCRRAGVPPEFVIAGRGPFSLEDNREVLRKNRIGVLVMKDSGEAGGAREKLRAAREENCRVVVVARPETLGPVYHRIDDLIEAIRKSVKSDCAGE